MALQAYRHLLRSTRIAFEGKPKSASEGPVLTLHAGDFNTLSAARLKVRQTFEANRTLDPESEERSKQITHAEEVAKFLRENVVQGQATGEGESNFSKCRKMHCHIACHLLIPHPELRIHEHTERGNNEDIKKPKANTLAGTRTKCCSS